jgi:hypothetical protein
MTAGGAWGSRWRRSHHFNEPPSALARSARPKVARGEGEQDWRVQKLSNRYLVAGFPDSRCRQDPLVIAAAVIGRDDHQRVL